MPSETIAGLLGTAGASARERRLALLVAAALLAAFALTAPFASRPCPTLSGFIPAYDAAIAVLDTLTAVLLYAQHRESRSPALLVLACGYAFTPPLVLAHALTFPDAFRPGYLVGGEQSTAWLWMAWHGVFPFFIAAYALCRRAEDGSPASFAWARRPALAFGFTFSLAGLLVLATVAWSEALPRLMLGNRYQSVATNWVLTLGWMAHLAALAMLFWLTRARRRIELWISVILLASAIDLALSALLVDARFQLGFYAGRLYGLLAASFVLILLLRASFRMQADTVRAWDAMRASEARFRTLADTAPALIWRNDERGRNVFINRYFADFTGRTAAGIAGGSWRDLLHPDEADAYVAGYLEALGAQRPWQQRSRIRRHDGQWRWLDHYAQPLYAPDGRYAGQVGVSIDVTDKVEAERSLQESARRKDEFLATLAHELRNPLAPISTALQLLRHVHGGRRSADKLIAIVDRQVGHMIRLVDDLLEISRITNGRIVLARQRVDLREVLRSACESSMPHIEQGRHQVELALPAAPLWVDGDPVRLNQVFANLLNNAAKYTDSGGRILLAAEGADGWTRVAVRDNGIGIPAEMLDKIFELFRQVPEAALRGQGGLGIGLSMVRQLVAMHGGSVEARSGGARLGSEFVVRLPLARGAAQGAPDASSPPPASRPAAGRGVLAGCSVLIVDDNRDAADMLAQLLEADGAEVRVAHNGRSALAELDRYHPKAVLLDIGLPDISGYDIARRIRGNPTLSDVRLIAVTGWGQDGDRKRSHDCGFSEHLTKPVDIARLESLLAA